MDFLRRKLTAILSADVKGYSRLVGDDEEATVRTITACREVMATLIGSHRGRVVDSPGDNLLAEFARAVETIQCATRIQIELETKNAQLPDHRRMMFRIGINIGDVIVKGEAIHGDGVNIAARLESLADPGGICISGFGSAMRIHSSGTIGLCLGEGRFPRDHNFNLRKEILSSEAF